MNNFFKTFWAAFLAFIAANVVLGIFSFFFFIVMLAAIGSNSDKKVTVKDGSILKITLEEAIVDSPSGSPLDNFDPFTMKATRSNTILDVLSAIETAADDSRIEGIYLDIKGGSINTGNLEELRNAIEAFKKAGKFVVSYSDVYSQGQYYLCSAANVVYMNPQGGLDWHGLSAQVMFYKGLLDKLGVEPVVLRHGSFKAAVEPFIMNEMSPENREQNSVMVNSMWSVLLGDVARSRGLDSLKLSEYASTLAIYSPEKAMEMDLVDGLVYNDEVKGILNNQMGKDADDDINFITLPKYITALKSSSKHTSKNRIEVIYAEGSIVDGESSKGNVGGNTIAKKLEEARKNKRVKAVVLRVNSPGGSALASEVMWRELQLLKAEKPVVVSMGGVAASGGYYISCPADIILADRMTITGSIGVFGLMFNLEKGLKEKLGISVDVVRTNPSSDIGSPYRKMTDPERAYIMHSIENIYSTFVNHVAEGRNLTFEQVDAIGGGRVWSGVDAKRIGLIDGFGGIKDAITLAADRAGVAGDYVVHEAVTTTDPFTALLESLTEVKTTRIKSELGEAFIHYNALQSILSQQGVQARMPYDVEVK